MHCCRSFSVQRLAAWTVRPRESTRSCQRTLQKALRRGKCLQASLLDRSDSHSYLRWPVCVYADVECLTGSPVSLCKHKHVLIEPEIRDRSSVLFPDCFWLVLISVVSIRMSRWELPIMLAGQRSDPQNRKERAKAAAEAEQPDHEKYTGTTDGTPVGQPVGATVTC